MPPSPDPPAGRLPAPPDLTLAPRPGTRLVAVAGVLAVMLAVSGAVLAWRNYQGDRGREIEQAATLSRAAAADTDRFLRDRINLLEALALSSAARTADLDALRDLFARVHLAEPGFAEVLWANLRGEIVAHALPDSAGGTVSIADRDYFRAVLATGEPFISAAVVGRLTTSPVVVLAVPTLDEHGTLTGVLAAGVTLQQLAETLNEFRDGTANALLIVDRADQLIVDDNPATAIADVSGSALVRRARAGGRGVLADTTGVRGDAHRRVAFAPVPAAGWLILVERPSGEAFARARHTFVVTLAALGVMVLAGVSGMAWTGRELDRMAATQRWALLEAMAENQERRRADEALRNSERRFRSLAQNASDIVVVLDADGTLQYVSPSVERVLGYRSEDWVGRGAFELVHPDDLERLRHRFAAVAKQPGVYRPIEFRLRAADGTWRDLEATANNLLHDPTVGGIVENIRDVTERRRAEASLRLMAESGSLLASSLEYDTTLARIVRLAVPTLADWCTIHLVEEGGEIRRTALVHVEPEQEEFLEAVRRRYPFTAESAHPVARVLRSGEPLFYPHVTDDLLRTFAHDDEHLALLRRLLGSYMVVPLTARGRTLGVLALVCTPGGRTYTSGDLVLAEALARRAALAIDNARLYHEAQAALTARERFFSSVSHDLRTPLTSIKAYAQMLHRRARRGAGLQAGPETLEALEAVDDATKKMSGLIDELLDLSRLQTGRALELDRRTVDMVALVRQEVAEVQRTAVRHDIQLDADEGELIGVWDPARLERVVGNLLSNAAKYSPAGGVVSVTLRRAEDEAGEWASLRVRDTGIGIPAADLPHIFERFHRGANVGKILGTGIGLAGARQIVEQHGGTITVESKEGQGTTVTVRLPLER